MAEIHDLLQQYGYAAVFAALLLENFGVPVPGETMLIAAAIAASAGDLDILPLLGLAFLACVIGDNIGYGIGLKGGRQVVLRYGKWLFITAARLGKVEDFLARHGGKVVLVARFFAIARQLNGIVAGIARMRWRLFLGCNAAGAALWVGFWGGLAYWAGTRSDALLAMARATGPWVVAAFVLVGLVAWGLDRRRPVIAGDPLPMAVPPRD